MVVREKQMDFLEETKTRAGQNEQDEKLALIQKRNQADRFNNLGDGEKKKFLDDLIQEDGFRPEVADRIYRLFESGDAASVDDALRILETEDNESSKNPGY